MLPQENAEIMRIPVTEFWDVPKYKGVVLCQRMLSFPEELESVSLMNDSGLVFSRKNIDFSWLILFNFEEQLWVGHLSSSSSSCAIWWHYNLLAMLWPLWFQM